MEGSSTTPSPADYGSTRDTTKTPNTYTVQRALDHGGLGLGNMLPISLVLFCMFIEASEYMVLGIILPKLKCQWSLTPTQVVLIPMVTIVSACVGGLSSAHLMGLYGRYYPIIISMFLSSVAGVISALSQSLIQFLIARGLTIGLLEVGTTAGTVYSIEYSPTTSRPLIFSLFGVFYGLGSLTAGVTCFLFLESAGWRVVLVILTVPGFIASLLLLTQRETPFYDVACGKIKDARETIERVWSLNSVEPLSGELVRHDTVGNPTEVTSILKLPFGTDTQFTKHTISFLLINFLTYCIWAFTAFSGPRLLNEGYCNSNVTVGHKQDCHTYSGNSLLLVTLTSLGEIVGSIVLLTIISIGYQPFD
eukprot:sb/3465977/